MNFNHHYADKKMAVTVGKWDVNIQGDMCYSNYYWIEKDRLMEKDWVLHLMGKSWCDLNEFIPAYLQAIKNIGKEEVTISVNY